MMNNNPFDQGENCLTCNNGKRVGGSCLYDYYNCGHAYEKPLDSKEKGRWVNYKSPHLAMKKSYEKKSEIESDDKKAVREFAKVVCKIRDWIADDAYFTYLVDAIEKGNWDDQFKLWIAGRQSVLDELKNGGHSMGEFVNVKR